MLQNLALNSHSLATFFAAPNIGIDVTENDASASGKFIVEKFNAPDHWGKLLLAIPLGSLIGVELGAAILHAFIPSYPGPMTSSSDTFVKKHNIMSVIFSSGVYLAETLEYYQFIDFGSYTKYTFATPAGDPVIEFVIKPCDKHWKVFLDSNFAVHLAEQVELALDATQDIPQL